jgi:hypothetical protein
MARLPWFKVDVAAANHPKIQRLERLLEVSDAFGLVVRLWTWTAAYYPEGEFPVEAAEYMAKASIGPLLRMGGPGVTGVTLDHRYVTESMVSTGILEPHGDRYVVHGWSEHQQAHADHAMREREQNAERQRRFRNRKKLDDVTRDVTRDVTQSNGGDKSRVDKKKKHSLEPEEAPASKPAVEDDSPVVALLPVVGKGPKEYPVTQAKMDEWQAAYPGVDVQREVRSLVQWARDNPTKRKTFRGAAAFFSRNLARKQDSKPTNGRANGRNEELQRARAEAEAYYRSGERDEAIPDLGGLGLQAVDGGPENLSVPPNGLAPDATALSAHVGALLGHRRKAGQLQDADDVEPRA